MGSLEIGIELLSALDEEVARTLYGRNSCRQEKRQAEADRLMLRVANAAVNRGFHYLAGEVGRFRESLWKMIAPDFAYEQEPLVIAGDNDPDKLPDYLLAIFERLEEKQESSKATRGTEETSFATSGESYGGITNELDEVGPMDLDELKSSFSSETLAILYRNTAQ